MRHRIGNTPVFILFGCNGYDAGRKSGCAFDIGPGCQEDGTGRGYFVEAIQEFDLDVALAEDVAFTDEVSCFSCDGRCVGIKGFMAVSSGMTDFVDVFQGI